MIHKKMIEVMKKISHIGKDRKNQAQGFNFRGIDDVMNELHGTMSEVGVFVIPQAIGDTIIDERTTKAGGISRFIVQRWQYTFFAEDGSSVTATAIGEAMDSGDKAMNKSMSIALKYCLLQTFLIPTEEEKDPDAQSPKLPPKANNKIALVNDDQVKTINAMIELSEIDPTRFLEYFKISTIEQLPANRFEEAIKKLNATIDLKNAEGAKNA